MKPVAAIAKWFVIGALALWIVPWIFFTKVEPGQVGVRRSAVGGVDESDLGAGWRLRIPGLHRMTYLPSTYFFLDYTDDTKGPQEPLQIRTKDNNNVTLDVSVPVRIKPGRAHAVVKAGNHMREADGRYRYMRLAEQTAVSVLREELASLDSVGFYSTERRLAVSDHALVALNAALGPLNLEAQAVLIRAVQFRAEYEKQLQSIQLNEQNKLLDGAREKLAAEQQKLDNYNQGTAALASAREQDWIKRRAELERAYQLGGLDLVDPTPGAARAALAGLTPEQLVAAKARVAAALGIDAAVVTDAYLIGINNLQAETLEYKNRVTAEGEAVAARLEAEGAALLAKVQGEYEAKLNALLGSPAGRAYVAWQAAANISFAKTLTFSSQDGVPSVLRLRQFAEQFMGK
jgi:hypothetical protein